MRRIALSADAGLIEADRINRHTREGSHPVARAA